MPARPAMFSVAVILAIYKPDAQRLERQLECLFAQEDVAIEVFAVLDRAGDEGAAQPPVLHRYPLRLIEPPHHLGARGAFAAGLAAALAAGGTEDRLFAYCDQDDVWHPRKLAETASALRGANAALAHCDARVVRADGSVVSPSLHRFERREEAADLLDAILLNSVTGMTAVFTAATARLAVKLMDGLPSAVLHDHVTAVAAMAMGPVVRVPQPLVDYVQHGENVLGASVPPLPHWWQRSFVLKDVRAYRQTSARVFEDRRTIAAALQREGIALGPMAEMFRLPPRVSSLRLLMLYTLAFWSRMLDGRPRRAMWCWRLGDAALFGATASGALEKTA
ncbi:glycosyltransferase [Aestuariivirga sp.]|uniref:glycosyltransferase n=1 Tax=Aestuariivirga sp. TaxID=2650926 RepID=UPI0039E261CC